MVGGPLGISLAPLLKSRYGGIYNALKPIAHFYANLCGHRQMGLKYDDLIPEEREDVQKALGRLNARESYDRAFRLRVAIQQSILHRNLPKDQWVTPEEDQRYLTPIIDNVVKEDEERAMWDSMKVERQKKT